MNSYETRQQARLDRYKKLSKKAEIQSEEAYESSSKLGKVLPFGQPILVGHHSETAHRNLIKRMHNKMDKSVKLQEMAEYYKTKAEAIENNNTISSDDPDAIQKLDTKIDLLEKQRKEIKSREHESWELSNLSQNIRSIKVRINKLKQLQNIQDSSEIINGVNLKVNKEANRIQLLFPAIPSIDMRTRLKKNGFRWSPTNQAWQGYINNHTMYKAQELLKT